eukprot:Clim_evm5s154 gene=Clim_evmTU5s154
MTSSSPPKGEVIATLVDRFRSDPPLPRGQRNVLDSAISSNAGHAMLPGTDSMESLPSDSKMSGFWWSQEVAGERRTASQNLWAAQDRATRAAQTAPATSSGSQPEQPTDMRSEAQKQLSRGLAEADLQESGEEQIIHGLTMPVTSRTTGMYGTLPTASSESFGMSRRLQFVPGGDDDPLVQWRKQRRQKLQRRRILDSLDAEPPLSLPMQSYPDKTAQPEPPATDPSTPINTTATTLTQNIPSYSYQPREEPVSPVRRRYSGGLHTGVYSGRGVPPQVAEQQHHQTRMQTAPAQEVPTPLVEDRSPGSATLPPKADGTLSTMDTSGRRTSPSNSAGAQYEEVRKVRGIVRDIMSEFFTQGIAPRVPEPHAQNMAPSVAAQKPGRAAAETTKSQRPPPSPVLGAHDDSFDAIDFDNSASPSPAKLRPSGKIADRSPTKGIPRNPGSGPSSPIKQLSDALDRAIAKDYKLVKTEMAMARSGPLRQTVQPRTTSASTHFSGTGADKENTNPTLSSTNIHRQIASLSIEDRNNIESDTVAQNLANRVTYLQGILQDVDEVLATQGQGGGT